MSADSKVALSNVLLEKLLAVLLVEKLVETRV